MSDQKEQKRLEKEKRKAEKKAAKAKKKAEKEARQRRKQTEKEAGRENKESEELNTQPPEDKRSNKTEEEEQDPGYFRYTDRPGAGEVTITPIMDSEKYRHAKSVYDRLVKAKGDFRYPIPEFVMSREERMVAWMNYDALQIGMEEKAYDACNHFGDQAEAAIAMLLAHELTHYYEKHAWRRNFAASFRDLDIGLKLDKVRDNVVNETQADYLGGFLSYSAGFPAFDRTPEFMAQVYRAYGFPDEIGDNYPSLSDRQALARRSADRMQRLIDVFEMANWLTATGKYALAIKHYIYILQEYQSRELYNNLGVLFVLNALEYFTEEELVFRFPLELDLDTSRPTSRIAMGPRDELLKQAIQHFDYAISLDPDYAPAYLNKACAYALIGDPVRAQFYAETEALHRAQGNLHTKTATDAEVLLGILAAQRQNEALALDYFNKAVDKGSAVAAINRDILQGNPVVTGTRQAFEEEKIDEVDLNAYAGNPAFDEPLSVALAEDLSLLQKDKPVSGSRSRILMSYDARVNSLDVFHVTPPDYEGATSKGIGLGASAEDIVEQYGEPMKRIETPKGTLLAYANLLFKVDEKDGLRQWIVYKRAMMG